MQASGSASFCRTEHSGGILRVRTGENRRTFQRRGLRANKQIAHLGSQRRHQLSLSRHTLHVARDDRLLDHRCDFGVAACYRHAHTFRSRIHVAHEPPRRFHAGANGQQQCYLEPRWRAAHHRNVVRVHVYCVPAGFIARERYGVALKHEQSLAQVDHGGVATKGRSVNHPVVQCSPVAHEALQDPARQFSRQQAGKLPSHGVRSSAFRKAL